MTKVTHKHLVPVGCFPVVYYPLHALAGGGARILLTEVPDPERFGAAQFDAGGRIVGLSEKPVTPPLDYAIIGLYAYEARLWGILQTLELSERGQYGITDGNNAYLQAGRLEYDLFAGQWSDAGTHESLHHKATKEFAP
ncbi:MAG: sugar phosphate nucleotidyltransferase [Armatimonadota bacterium]